MHVQVAVGTVFVVMLWAAWPSRRVREVARKTAVALLSLGLVSTIGIGLVQLIRPDLSDLIHHPAVKGWVADRMTELQRIPHTVWLSLGLGTVIATSLQSLYRLAAPVTEVKQVRRPVTAPVSAAIAAAQHGAQVGRSELQRAIDAMSQAQEPASAAGHQQRRVEDLLRPR